MFGNLTSESFYILENSIDWIQNTNTAGMCLCISASMLASHDNCSSFLKEKQNHNPITVYSQLAIEMMPPIAIHWVQAKSRLPIYYKLKCLNEKKFDDSISVVMEPDQTWCFLFVACVFYGSWKNLTEQKQKKKLHAIHVNCLIVSCAWCRIVCRSST